MGIVRFAAVAIVAAATPLHAVAHDGFELDLDELLVVVAGGSSATTSMGDDRHSLDMEGPVGGCSSHDLVSRSSATARTNHEYRLALWDAPMGRLHYERAAAESMLGREGLVGGGRLSGPGAATTALGDAAPGGLRLLLAGETWKTLSPGEKVEVGLEASFVAALLSSMADSALSSPQDAGYSRDASPRATKRESDRHAPGQSVGEPCRRSRPPRSSTSSM